MSALKVVVEKLIIQIFTDISDMYKLFLILTVLRVLKDTIFN